MAELLDKVVEVVRTFSEERQLGLAALYLFGSYSSNHATSESDLDLGILLESPLTEEGRWALIEKLQEVWPHDLDIDLVDLARADTVITAQIISTGRRILTLSISAVEKFEVYALSRYARLNEERAHLLSDILERGTVFAK